MRFHTDHLSLDLNGAWSFAYTTEPVRESPRSVADIEATGMATYPCQVPGNLELDLHAAGLLPDPFYGMNMTLLRPLEHAHVWYWRRFRAPEEASGTPQLVFEGLDCFAKVYLNGQLIGTGDNMLVEQVFSLDDTLQPDNELLVHIRPAYDEASKYTYPPSLNALGSNYESLYVRKAPHMYGWDIMPRAVSAGIWRPVTLRFRPPSHIAYVYLETLDIAPDHSHASLAAHYQVSMPHGADDRCAIRLHGECGGSAFDETHPLLFDAGLFRFRVDGPELWWPRGRGEASLYRCQATLLVNDEEVDSVAFTHGVRTVELDRTSVTDASGSGEFCFRINGERVFAMGSNWVPVDAFHSRDAERIPQIISMANELGCNMLRCWGGNVYEDDSFYELCDTHGIMIWQDFAMACAVYPQDADFCQRLEAEARQVVRRLRQHPCIVLWAGDNECDAAYSWGGRQRDPNSNVLTREVLPRVLRDEDPTRPYLPSSPYIDPVAYQQGEHLIPENHLWGPRDYYKGDYYKNPISHFASEMGYHGCPSPTSIRRFISPEKVWPYQDNDEWLLHATSPVPGVDLFDYRIELMAKQVRELFGEVPDNLEEYAFASQISQAEAKKYFIELFRSDKWRRTGILWWNLIDGWPQFSDAIVDYYFGRKLAYSYIQRAQAPLCLVLKEPSNWDQALVACNDTRQDLHVAYSILDVASGEKVTEGAALAKADAVTPLERVPFSNSWKRLYVLAWESELGPGKSHYLAGNPPFDLAQVRMWLARAELLSAEWLREAGFPSTWANAT